MGEIPWRVRSPEGFVHEAESEVDVRLRTVPNKMRDERKEREQSPWGRQIKPPKE